MIRPEFLEMLRCPLDPRNTRLEEGPDGLVCQRCRIVFLIKEGIPSLLPEDARLPDGYDNLASLPCQANKAPLEKSP
jgi:uncharacterized protein YbaR (Trm112 family)